MCNTARDCLEFFNDGVLRSCLTDLTVNESYCGCNNFYVRTGPNCEKISINLFIFQLQTLVNFSFAVNNFITGVSYIIKNRSSSSFSKLLRKQRMIIICQILGNTFFLVSYLLLLPTLLSNKKLELNEIFCLNKTVEKVLSLNSKYVLPMAFLGSIIYNSWMFYFSIFLV